MNRTILRSLCLVLMLPGVSLAQGSGIHRAPDPTGVRDSLGPAPFMVTREVDGKIAEINAAQHLVVIEDKNGKRLSFKLDDKTKLKADKKTEYAGKKKLLLSDFEMGQPVRVTYLASNTTAIELRLRHVKQ